MIAVCQVTDVLRHKLVPRHLGHRSQYLLVGNVAAPRTELLGHHTLARGGIIGLRCNRVKRAQRKPVTAREQSDPERKLASDFAHASKLPHRLLTGQRQKRSTIVTALGTTTIGHFASLSVSK